MNGSNWVITPSSTLRSLPTLRFAATVPLDLRLAATERDEHRERKQLTGPHVDTGASQVIAEAVRRQETLEWIS